MRVNKEPMNMQEDKSETTQVDDLREHYDFDYSKAKPNRFAARLAQAQLMVVLDPDMAAIFPTSKAEWNMNFFIIAQTHFLCSNKIFLSAIVVKFPAFSLLGKNVNFFVNVLVENHLKFLTWKDEKNLSCF